MAELTNIDNFHPIEVTNSKLIIPSCLDSNAFYLQIKSSCNHITCNVEPGKKIMLFAEIFSQKEIDLHFESALLRYSSLELVFFTKQCQSIILKLNIKLLDQYSTADIRNISILDNKDKIVIQTLQDHQAPYSCSNVLNTAVLSKYSNIQFNGLINIHENANNSQSSQYTRNIMLSKFARAEVSPNLNILNNNVICNHGATIGQFDQTNIYYLQSRGIPKKLAQNLLINGYLSSAFDNLYDPFWAKIIDLYKNEEQLLLSQ